MESPANDHSDSDSGESWTLLDHDSALSGDININKSFIAENCENDEDTDGISIISDSETESPSSFFVDSHHSILENQSTEEVPVYSPKNIELIPNIIPSKENNDTESNIISKEKNDTEPNINIKENDIELNLNSKEGNDTDPNINNKENNDTESNVNSKESNNTQPNIYSKHNNDIETNEDNIIGDNIKHKIYVHRRNNRISTVLNIIMLVSVMTAAGVAIGHMWGAKNDCPSQSTTSFNKILSDLYKLQAENANYRNRLKELSFIIEDNLHNECERESEVSLNKQQTVNCRQQKIHEIQKYLKNNIVEGKRNKRTVQKQEENEFRKSINAQNISKVKAIKEQKIDEKSISTVFTVTDKPQQQEQDEGIIIPQLEEVINMSERKISYADSLKTNNVIKENINDNEYKNTEKKFKYHKKTKEKYNIPQNSVSEEEFVNNRYSTKKHKSEWKKHDHQKPRKNSKKINKYEDSELKEGLLKYDDLSFKLLDTNDNNFMKLNFNRHNKKRNKQNKNVENDQGKINPYDDYINKLREAAYNTKSEENLNWYDNRAQLHQEARKRQHQELLNGSTSNTGEWYFKRMHKREQFRAKENSTSKRIPKKRTKF